jgi:hypothetical protein
MADRYIGAARLHLPERLTMEAHELLEIQRLHRRAEP